jgi:hypothetical protein
MKIDGVEVQATHVKISDDGYVFVSYNDKGEAHRGGVVVYKYTIHDGPLETVKVDVVAVSSIKMPKAELSALDYYNGKLYMAGASSDPNFGYRDEDGWNYAFFMVMELNPDKTFKPIEPEANAIQQLTSFQATSIRALNNRIYITTGDGTNGTKGGLYVFNAINYQQITFIEKDNARSVDADAVNVYLMQAEPARITKYDLDGKNGVDIYPTDSECENESMQHHAKSEILVWGKYLFAAVNESGLRMLNKANGDVNMWLDRPGEDAEKHVTNAVCMNSDVKKNAQGQDVKSNMLLLANGEKGVYWYDVIDAYNKEWIVASEKNSILGEAGLSTNFIASKGSIVFVANGLGGLKVLYIGTTKDPNWDCTNATSDNTSTFLKENGNDGGVPESRKIGDILFQAEGDNLVVYIYSTKNINNSGVFFGASLQDYADAELLSDTALPLESNNIIDGKMANINAKYRTVISSRAVKFTFPKSALPNNGEGKLICSIYTSMSWGYGKPFGPSGTTGNSSTNNGQYIELDGVTFCTPLKRTN